MYSTAPADWAVGKKNRLETLCIVIYTKKKKRIDFLENQNSKFCLLMKSEHLLPGMRNFLVSHPACG